MIWNWKTCRLYLEDKSVPWKPGVIPRKGNNESKLHYLLKLKVCLLLAEKGGKYEDFVVEAKIKDGGRYDIIVPLAHEIYEITVSETKKDLVELKSFPTGFRVFMVEGSNGIPIITDVSGEVKYGKL